MLVARAVTRDHKDLLLVGLSAENRRRLGQGLPIELTIDAMLGPLQIVIFGGETEAAMQGDLSTLINDATVVVDRYSTEAM